MVTLALGYDRTLGVADRSPDGAAVNGPVQQWQKNETAESNHGRFPDSANQVPIHRILPQTLSRTYVQFGPVDMHPRNDARVVP